jgi:uncharacterized membrane protein
MNAASLPGEKQLRKMVRNTRWILGLSRNWLKIVLAFLFLYTGLSLTPPLLMKAGLEGAANTIYTIYAPMCHQFAFRSLFFFGDQLVYPRETSGTDLKPFEYYAVQDAHFEHIDDIFAWSPELQVAARSFKGNDQMGYKTALCERDVAIYGTMFLVGLLFMRVRRWLRPASLWLYLVLGLMPMGIDGFSQMFGYPPFEFWPMRETLPTYRILTGALFGLMNVWLAFPYLEASMHETIAVMGERLDMAQQLLRAVQDEK